MPSIGDNLMPMSAKSLDALQHDIGVWQSATFGGGEDRAVPIVLHIEREIQELATETLYLNRLDDVKPREQKIADIALETADIIILLCGLAHRLGFSLAEAVEAKMAINRARTWNKPDADGVITHEKK